LETFRDQKIVCLVEAEISELGRRSRDEDLVLWIEGVGVFVVEVKSHTIGGIRSFENNVPRVVYQGEESDDVDLLSQPRDFAYKLKSELEKGFDGAGLEPPPLYYAGWLPNVSPEDVNRLGATVAPDKVWLSDMLEREVFLARRSVMKNITRGTNTERSSLELFCGVFGATSGLTRSYSPRTHVASMGHSIDRKNLRLKRLTKEQEVLAFSPNLVRGPKVIRGVAGSGKTVVLANAVAETLLDAMSEASGMPAPTQSLPSVLVLCYNRTLVPYLRKLIGECFNQRKPKTDWRLPGEALTIVNIDRLAYGLVHDVNAVRGSEATTKMDYNPKDVAGTVELLTKGGTPRAGKYRHVFIDEGQDIDLAWYPLVRELTSPDEEFGPSIIVFYDTAQNLYGVKRPGVGGVPPWTDLLGGTPHPRGLHTVMRVGHRNTNQILSFSFNLLLGAFADENPQLALFAGMNEYETEVIPDDPAVDHPNAGKLCVERLDDRQYRVNFSVENGKTPDVFVHVNEEEMLAELTRDVERVIDPKRGNVEPSDVLIMAAEKKDVRSVVEALKRRKVPVHVPVELEDRKETREKRPRVSDPRDMGCFQPGMVTVSTIKSAKGYTAHVCHLAYVHRLDCEGAKKEVVQRNRAQLHVACTRSSLFLSLWGLQCPLMSEAVKARAAVDG
jgi:superfamily I DNA and RNA helicase